MRRAILPVLALALAVAVAAPAGAINEPEVLEPCTDTAGAVVVTPGSNTAGIDTPIGPLWLGEEQTSFVLDLAGRPVSKRLAQVNVTMSWDIVVEDYDLDLLDASGGELDHSENVQPLDPAEEFVSATLSHCDRFTAAALNWAAAGASELVLDVGVTPLN